MEISIRGPRILWVIENVPVFGSVRITQTVLVSWVVMAILTGLCIWLGSGLRVTGISRKQAVAEWLFTALTGFVRGNMGSGFDGYMPLVGTIFATSLISNLISLVGFWSPTADLMTELGWALVVFALITRHKIKASGIGGYFIGFTKPFAVMTPINLLAEAFTPVSMACRHFGNILSGGVISALLYGVLTVLSGKVFGMPGVRPSFALTVVAGMSLVLLYGWNRRKLLMIVLGSVGLAVGGVVLLSGLWDFLGKIPWLGIGIPAITGFYFDWFSGAIQAFIFCTLTTIFIKQAAQG